MTEFKVGDTVWAIYRKYIFGDNRPNKVEMATIERTDTVTDLKDGTAILRYKMKEGCSHFYFRTQNGIYSNKSEAEEIARIKNDKFQKQVEIREEYESMCEKGKPILDGVYDVTDIPHFLVDDTKHKEAIGWMKKHKTFWVASAYETNIVILLTDEPKKLNKSWYKENYVGSGFNHGSTNILQNCPKDILILAEND